MKQCILFNVFPHVSSPLISNEDVVCMPTVSNDFLRSTVVVNSLRHWQLVLCNTSNWSDDNDTVSGIEYRDTGTGNALRK